MRQTTWSPSPAAAGPRAGRRRPPGIAAAALLAALVAPANGRPVGAGHGGTLQLAAVPAGPYAVSVWTHPSPARPGPGQVDVAVMRPGGMPVPDVAVRVRLEAPGGRARTEVAARRDADPLGVRYRAVVDLPAAGEWRVTVAIDGPAGAGTAAFPLAVEPGGWGWWPAWGAAVVAAAVLAWRLRRRSGAAALAGALIVAAGVLAAGSAWPHASLVRSSPARRATLATAPDRVQLWFNEAVEARFSTASVWDGAGQQVDLGDARVEPEDPKRLVVGVTPLGPGTYRVRFRVLSVDGHVVESEFPFTVRP